MSIVRYTSVACVLAVILAGWSGAAASDGEILSETSGLSNSRQPRHLKSKLCLLGLCGGQGYGGYQGGHQGGYGGYQGYPPINIGISQSQSSSSAGGGGFGSGYFPNNYQYNGYPGGYPGGHNSGYHGGFNRPGHLGNGFGSYNNQFNGNYYGGRPQGGGYGLQGPYGNFYDEGNDKPVYEDQEDYFRSAKSKD